MRWGAIVPGSTAGIDKRLDPDEIDWTYLFDAYAYWKEMLPPRRQNFSAFFKKLAGSNELQEALESGMSVEEWVNSY